MNTTITAISILSFFIGQWLVTRHCCSGFFIWAASNLMVALLHFAKGDFSTACMFTVYFLANSSSVVAWVKQSYSRKEATLGGT